MAAQTYVVTGTLTNQNTVILDEEVPITDTKVRVTIEPLINQHLRPLAEVLEEIRRQQQERGHVPPTAEEVDEYIRQERASWDSTTL
jgi:hypothetical protein